MKAYIQIFYNLFLISGFFQECLSKKENLFVSDFPVVPLEKEDLFVLDFPSRTSRKRGSIRFGFSQ